MNKEQMPMVWAYANTIWGTFKVPDTKESVMLTMEVWLDLLKEYDLQIIMSAMLELAKESDFCNVVKVAENCKTLVKLANNELVDEDMICNEIRMAIKNSLYHAREEFDKLSEIAKRIVGSPASLRSWAELDSATVSSVVMSNIKKSASNQIERQNKMEVIEQANLRQAIENKKVDLLEG